MISLYPHQVKFVDALRHALRQHDSVMGQAATGFGKTITGAWIAQAVADRGNRVIFSVHRKNLIYQTERTFDSFGIEHSHIASGRQYSADAPVYVASIDSLRRRLEHIPAPDLLVIDEAHMAAARTWVKVVSHYRDHGSKVLGLSATPRRLDGKPLSWLFSSIVHGPSVRWLMDNGYLSDYVAWAPSQPDLTGVHTRVGDFKRDELEEATDRPKLTGDAAKHYKKHALNTRAIAYCVSIEHSKNVAAQFNAEGIPAAHIDGTTPEDERQSIIHAFADGACSVLCNVELITTGFDLSSQVGREVPVETIISLRPTQSLTLHLQMLGRGLRAKDKPAIILDHSGNILRHGLPDDEIDWQLDRITKAPRNTDPVIAIRQCERCFFVYRPAPQCPNCGFTYPIQSREIQQVDGELEVVDVKAMRQSQRVEERNATTYDELVALGKKRGYSNPYGWANKRMMGRARSAQDLIALAEQRGIKNPSAWAHFNFKRIRGRRRTA